MHSRRATISYWPSSLSGHINSFEEGDVVVSVTVADGNFYGVVKDVDKRINKISVAWGGGSLCQHDPEEIQLSQLALQQDMALKVASRRASSQYVGNPDTHGMKTPISGGTDVLQNMEKAHRKERLEEAKKNPKTAGMKSRRAMYWCGPDRTYRMTRSEKASGDVRCPKCCGSMDSHKFTKRAKLFMCDECGFKITSDKVLRDRPDYGEVKEEESYTKRLKVDERPVIDQVRSPIARSRRT